MLNQIDALYVAGFIVNFISAFIIIRFIYYPRQGEHAYLFTFLAFNTVIYFIMGLFTSIELSIGVGFGLFALFSILRYRTETVPIHEMTYLFVMVALPILNSILFGTAQYEKLVLTDAIIIGVIWALEKGWGFDTGQYSKQIVYEKIDLIQPGKRDEMIADLKERTGLSVTNVQIDMIDFLRDTAKIRIFYTDIADPGKPDTPRPEDSSASGTAAAEPPAG
jgi:hypothetical protein